MNEEKKDLSKPFKVNLSQRIFENGDLGTVATDQSGNEFHLNGKPLTFEDPWRFFQYILDTRTSTLRIVDSSIENYVSRSNETNEDKSMVYQGREHPIVLSSRIDIPYGQHITEWSDVRSRRPWIPPQKKDLKCTQIEIEKCIACSRIDMTPEPRIYYPELIVNGFIPVSVPNLYPSKKFHLANFFTSHDRCDPSRIDQNDIRNYLKISMMNAQRFKDLGAKISDSFINLGAEAGCSQQHPHSQDGVPIRSKDKRAFSFTEKEIAEHFKQLSYYEDPQELFFNAMRAYQKLIAMETPNSILLANNGEKFPDGLDLYVKSSRITDFTRLEKDVIPDISYCIASAINFLATERGVTDMNIIAHQSYFNVQNGYRLHFHIYPRNKNRYAANESNNTPTVDSNPEETASAFRHYERGKF
jgi:galactose-1-phosphate uridylyltransferase